MNKTAMIKFKKDLQKYLYSNKIFIDDLYDLPGDEVVIGITGDWKHSHLLLDDLVAKFCESNGFVLKDKSMDVTYDSGMSFYTADHYYKIV